MVIQKDRQTYRIIVRQKVAGTDRQKKTDGPKERQKKWRDSGRQKN